MAKIKFSAAGVSVEVDCADGASCSQAMEVFQQVTGKVLSGVDLYADGKKVTDWDNTEAPNELIAVKSKHASA